MRSENRIRQWRDTHVRGTRTKPGAAGRVSVAITIGKSARVAQVTIKGFDADIDRGIESQTSRWRFAAPKDANGDPATATFDLALLLTAVTWSGDRWLRDRSIT